MLTTILLAALAAPPCSVVRIEAQIGADQATVHGAVTCVPAADGPLFVAAYPAALAGGDGIDDVNRPWLYPEGFEPAVMQLRQGSSPLAVAGVWTELGPARRGTPVRLEFVTRVPRRNGTLGRREGVAYLLGGWHPAFGRPAGVEPTHIEYSVRVPPGVAGFTGELPFGLTSARVRDGRFFGRFLPVLLAPELRVHTSEAGILLAPAPRRGGSRRELGAGLRDLTAGRDEEALTELVATLGEGHRFAARHGLSHGAPLVVVVAPLGDRLVAPFDGGLAVSSRAFHLLGFERFLKFHRLRIWREQLGLMVLSHARRVERQPPPRLIADLVGAALCARLALERYGGTEYAPDLLESFAVIPEIDTLLYAPQIRFVDTYFQAIDETPRARRGLDDFDHALPRGKLLYEKLVDLAGAAVTQRAVTEYLASREPFLRVAERVAGRDLGAELAVWLGPYPRVDYALGAVVSKEGVISVQVVARGPDAERVLEPVTVAVEDGEGELHRRTRLGPGELLFTAPGPPATVEIDPDGRLVELHHAAGEAARFNNRAPHAWRFLLNNIASLIAVTNGELRLAADFSLRRLHDLEHGFGFSTYYGPDELGASASATYGFGREVTPLHLAEHLGLALAYRRLRVESGGDLPGHQGRLTLSYSHDERLSPYWSFDGKGWLAYLAGGVTAAEHGIVTGYGQAGASAFYIHPFADGHALLGRLRGDLVLGPAPAQSLLRLGDRYRGGRGFEWDEARGGRRVIASLEYRHVLVADARTDLWGLLTWTGIEGALFGDAIYLPVAREGCHRDVFYDAGYGLRLIGDVLNVSPAEIAVDLGVPLRRCPDQAGRRPVTVYVAFVQSFAAF